MFINTTCSVWKLIASISGMICEKLDHKSISIPEIYYSGLAIYMHFSLGLCTFSKWYIIRILRSKLYSFVKMDELLTNCQMSKLFAFVFPTRRGWEKSVINLGFSPQKLMRNKFGFFSNFLNFLTGFACPYNLTPLFIFGWQQQSTIVKMQLLNTGCVKMYLQDFSA